MVHPPPISWRYELNTYRGESRLRVKPTKCALVATRAIALFMLTNAALTSASATGAETINTFENRAFPVALPGEECKVKPRREWTNSEKWAWKQICEDRPADFNENLKQKFDPTSTTKCEQLGDRRLSSTFLETILLYDPFRSVIPHHGVLIIGACFLGRIDLRDARVERPLVLDESRFESEVIMNRLTIPGRLSFDGSVFQSTFSMDSASVGGNLFMRDATFIRGVDLREAKVSNQFSMDGSTFQELTSMGSIWVGGPLLMREAKFGFVDLRSAEIKGQLFMSESTFQGHTNMGSILVEGSLLIEEATLNNLDLTKASIAWELWLLDINWAECKEYLKCKLTLQNASIGALRDTTATWSNKNLEPEFDGFMYGHLSGLRRESEWFIKDWLLLDKTYSPQPYIHLADVLRAAGHKEKADDILYENRERERENVDWDSWNGWFSWGVLTLHKYIVGYGYGWGYFQALVWIGILTFIGGCLVRWRERGKHDVELGFWYSLDMLLPIIHLRKWHSNIDLKDQRVRYYFYFHKIMGYVLTFFLTGLINFMESVITPT